MKCKQCGKETDKEYCNISCEMAYTMCLRLCDKCNTYYSLDMHRYWYENKETGCQLFTYCKCFPEDMNEEEWEKICVN